MDVGAPHSGFVFAAYGLSAAVLVILTLAVIVRDRRLRAEARALESRRHGAQQ